MNFALRRPPHLLHAMVFSEDISWLQWLEQHSDKLGYRVGYELLPDPKSIFTRMTEVLPHLILVDLGASYAGLQQVIGFMERTCPFVPVVGLHDGASTTLLEWQRQLMPGMVSRAKPEELQHFLNWAKSQKNDDTDQARRMRIMQQIEQNLRALEEMENFFDQGAPDPDSFSRQTQKEIKLSKQYLESLQAKLRKR